MDFESRYQFGLKLIRDAGNLALGYFNNRESLTIQTKGLQDLASEADMNTELFIKQRLQEAYPEDAFLGEETGHGAFDDIQGIWVVDPIDGTQPFIFGLSAWCVSIAFVQAGIVRFGMVFAPVRDEIFAGGAGHKATLNGQLISGSKAQSVKEGLVASGYSPKSGPAQFLPAFEGFLQAGGMFHREGSGALALCYVAAGRLIGFFEPLIRSWDCLGAVAVLQAAGQETSDFLANDGLFVGNPLVAGNAAVYAELRHIVNQAGGYKIP